MKRIKMILSVAAVTAAIGGAMATNMLKKSTLDVNVSPRQTPGTCPIKGTCTQASTPTVCRVTNTLVTLFTISGTTCQTPATGTFTAIL